MDRISSKDNARIKNIKNLMSKSRLRKDTGFFIAEGPRMVFETPAGLLREVYVAESFLEDDRWKSFHESLEGVEVFLVSDGVMRSVSDTVTPQGILAVVAMPRYELSGLITRDPFLVVLERLQDPGNMGTIFRTAEAAGATGIIMSADCVDVFSPKTVRSTMGSLYRVPFFVSKDIIKEVAGLKDMGIRIFAALPGASVSFYDMDYSVPMAFMTGNEGAGLTPELCALADYRINIPMEGRVESLNAAMATGILLYEGKRQRMKRGR